MSVIKPNVEWLLDYEIQLSSRHRRFVTLVLMAADKPLEELDQVLSDAIRSTDACFPEGNGIAVVMGETGDTDAIEAVNRYQRIVNGSMNVHYSVASYPTDGKTQTELMHVAQRRLETAQTLGNGAVVAEG